MGEKLIKDKTGSNLHRFKLKNNYYRTIVFNLTNKMQILSFSKRKSKLTIIYLSVNRKRTRSWIIVELSGTYF